MNHNLKIAVLGGAGRTGKYLVEHLLNQGYRLKMLLRHVPEDRDPADPFHRNLIHPLVEVIRGDAVNEKDIFTLLSGCQAVISTIGQRPGEPMVAGTATANVLKAMEKYAIDRYILVAGVNVDTPADKKGQQTRAATEWMKATFPDIHEDRAQAYAMLAKSTVNWTLVRLPVIEYTSKSDTVHVNTEDCRGQKISTRDIAVFLEQQLWDDTYSGQAPFLYNI